MQVSHSLKQRTAHTYWTRLKDAETPRDRNPGREYFWKLGNGHLLPQDSHPFPAVSKQSQRTDGFVWNLLLLLLKAMRVIYCASVTQAPCTVGQECPNLILSASLFIHSLFSCPKQCRKESGGQAVGTGNAGQPGLPGNTQQKWFHFNHVKLNSKPGGCTEVQSVTNDLLLVTNQATLVSLHVAPNRTNWIWPFSASKDNSGPMYLDSCKSTAVS